jgi:hypothetical protein
MFEMRFVVRSKQPAEIAGMTRRIMNTTALAGITFRRMAEQGCASAPAFTKSEQPIMPQESAKGARRGRTGGWNST